MQRDAYKTEVEELGAPSKGLTKCLFELECVDHAGTLTKLCPSPNRFVSAVW